MTNTAGRPAPKPRTLVTTASGSTYVLDVPMYSLPFAEPPYTGRRRPERGEAYDKGPRDRRQLAVLSRPAIGLLLVFNDATGHRYSSSPITGIEPVD